MCRIISHTGPGFEKLNKRTRKIFFVKQKMYFTLPRANSNRLRISPLKRNGGRKTRLHGNTMTTIRVSAIPTQGIGIFKT